jgi:hypothetical protein
MKWVFSPSPVEFSSHCHFYKLSHSWLLGMCAISAFSSRLIYLEFQEEFPLPHSSALRAPCPLWYVFFVVIAYYSFFSPGWRGVGLSRGLY